jgi:photosystem II stability/assembly factor-like uncharacterized protein
MKFAASGLVAVLAFAGSWEIQPLATRASFRGLSVVDEKTAWVSGSGATFVRTLDGGATWKVDSIAGKWTLDLRDIHAFSASSAVAISAGEAEKGLAHILRTTDGGATWTTVFTTDQKGVFFDAISFWDDRNGIVMSDPVDNRLFLLVTSDGGATWSRVPPEGLPEMLPGEAAFAASGTCLTVQGSSNAWIATTAAARGRSPRLRCIPATAARREFFPSPSPTRSMASWSAATTASRAPLTSTSRCPTTAAPVGKRAAPPCPRAISRP